MDMTQTIALSAGLAWASGLLAAFLLLAGFVLYRFWGLVWRLRRRV